MKLGLYWELQDVGNSRAVECLPKGAVYRDWKHAKGEIRCPRQQSWGKEIA